MVSVAQSYFSSALQSLRSLANTSNGRSDSSDRYEKLKQSLRRDILPVVQIGIAAAGCVAIGAAGAAVTLTPPLLSLGTQMGPAIQFLNLLPFLGAAIGAVIGSSTLSSITSACILSSVVGTVTAGREDTSIRLKWAAAHLALGFALSPICVAGAATAVVPTVLLGACAAGLSVILNNRLLNGESSWMSAIGGITLALAVGPAAAQLALGAGTATVVRHLIQMSAFGAVLSSIYAVYLNWPRLVPINTGYFEQSIVRAADVKKSVLALKSNPFPTVFGVPMEVEGLVNICRNNIREEKFAMTTAMLEGVRGAGKTETARGIANELGAVLAVVKKGLLEPINGSGTSASNMHRIFAEARVYARQHRLPVVLFFDEVESLAPDRDHLAGKTQEERESGTLVNALLHCIDGAAKAMDCHIVILAATNFADKVDPALRQRFLTKIQLSSPSQDDLRRIFAVHLNKYFHPDIFFKHLDTLAAEALRRNWVGRDVQAWVETLHVQNAVHPICPQAKVNQLIAGGSYPAPRAR